ncbi:MAG: hypothetical protein NTW30_04415 [Candidatus Aenigmarchaeota archaeon]|nr:hypothetical protein [Candidatus Aenigmarchaeota archaeon]
MSLKKRTVTPNLLRKYEVLRYIYLEPKTAEQLIDACSDIKKQHVITAIANLLSNHAIKKEKIIEEPKEITEIQNTKKLRSYKKKPKFRYSIIPNGKRKLAYFEWKYQLYTEWKTPWSDGFNDPYYEEMKKIIIEDLKLPT